MHLLWPRTTGTLRVFHCQKNPTEALLWELSARTAWNLSWKWAEKKKEKQKRKERRERKYELAKKKKNTTYFATLDIVFRPSSLKLSFKCLTKTYWVPAIYQSLSVTLGLHQWYKQTPMLIMWTLYSNGRRQIMTQWRYYTESVSNL